LLAQGFYALVTSAGAEIQTPSGSPVWKPGYIPAGPFTRVSHLVTKSYNVFNIPVKGCKLSCNTSVTIDCSMVFRIMGDESKGEDPELVRTFVHQVTPAGLQQLLTDAMAEEIRTLARSLHHTEVYAARSGSRAAKAQRAAQSERDEVGGSRGKDAAAQKAEGDRKMQGIEMGERKTGEVHLPPIASAEIREPTEDEIILQKGSDVTLEMADRLNAEFNKQGVEIHDIIIQDITLPNNIMQQMKNRTMVRSKQEYEVRFCFFFYFFFFCELMHKFSLVCLV
jgi:regulator of protease activity HflC (stomatin/prohibitin superfamily)